MRESTKHGSRLDEALKHETEPLEHGASGESRVREDLEKEEPSGSLPSAVEARRELSRHLRSSVFPADREALLDEARAEHAPEAVPEEIRALPPGVEFATVHEAWASLEAHSDPRAAAAREPLTDADR